MNPYLREILDPRISKWIPAICRSTEVSRHDLGMVQCVPGEPYDRFIILGDSGTFLITRLSTGVAEEGYLDQLYIRKSLKDTDGNAFKLRKEIT